jgi:hypothetical protein
LIIVGTTVLVVYRKKSAMKEAEAAYQAEVTGIHDQLKSLDLNDPAAAASILELAKAKESTWKDHPLAADIEVLLSKARANLAEAEEKRATLDRFTSLESDLKKTDLPPDRMKDLRRQLDEMEARMGTEGAELTARFAAARLTADKTYAKRLLEDAQDFSEANAGNPRPALARYQPVEDEIKGLLDRAYQAKNEELKAYYTPLYQDAIKDADVLATALFRTEGENLPWIDCLQPPQAANWNGSTVSGFSHQVQNGVLQIVGPDPDAGKMAVLSIGDREQWRHFEVDFELQVDKGDMEWYFRLGRSPNNNTLAYPLRTVKDPEHQGASNLEAGKKYSGRITLVGSKLKVKFDGAGEDLRRARRDGDRGLLGLLPQGPPWASWSCPRRARASPGSRCARSAERAAIGSGFPEHGGPCPPPRRGGHRVIFLRLGGARPPPAAPPELLVPHLELSPLILLLAQIAAIVLLSRLLGLVTRRLGQPLVVAEVLAGILLGPSLLGWLWPEAMHALFPDKSIDVLKMLSQVGLVLFMFLVGLEFDSKLLRGRTHSSVAISHTSIFVPFALGAAAAWWLHDKYSTPETRFLPFMLFLGASMSVTAFPVLARILSERGLMTSRVGGIAIACAAVDDVTAWCILAFVVAVTRATGVAAACWTTGLALAFIITMLVVIRPSCASSSCAWAGAARA